MESSKFNSSCGILSFFFLAYLLWVDLALYFSCTFKFLPLHSRKFKFFPLHSNKFKFNLYFLVFTFQHFYSLALLFRFWMFMLCPFLFLLFCLSHMFLVYLGVLNCFYLLAFNCEGIKVTRICLSRSRFKFQT